MQPPNHAIAACHLPCTRRRLALIRPCILLALPHCSPRTELPVRAEMRPTSAACRSSRLSPGLYARLAEDHGSAPMEEPCCSVVVEQGNGNINPCIMSIMGMTCVLQKSSTSSIWPCRARILQRLGLQPSSRPSLGRALGLPNPNLLRTAPTTLLSKSHNNPSRSPLVRSCLAFCTANVYPENPITPAKSHNPSTPSHPSAPMSCSESFTPVPHIKLSPPLPQLGVDDGFC
jgi:hypothetical protein